MNPFARKPLWKRVLSAVTDSAPSVDSQRARTGAGAGGAVIAVTAASAVLSALRRRSGASSDR
ncbi:hypothetical protein K8W59_04895 [Nocardioides rotundus]|uniref:hypothetical protein n=1 Tax=Nocardioides rotundus TaxID=1774216 RepID=UPI001CBA7170|nr:hypothetical protein [Nocardioides rotundus]UAL30843.1 hypothetical protein K8W59_04895 [Nocardioides rotundus]